jgi:hypothetical protein
VLKYSQKDDTCIEELVAKKTTELVWAQVDRVSAKLRQIKPSLFGQIKAARTVFGDQVHHVYQAKLRAKPIVWIFAVTLGRPLITSHTLAKPAKDVFADYLISGFPQVGV